MDPNATSSNLPDNNNRRASSVQRAAGSISLFVMASRVLGLVREQVFLSLFGASQSMDAFIAAFRIPNLLRDLFAEGALSTAFVSTFTKVQQQNGVQAAWKLGNLVVSWLVATLSLITLAGILFAPELVSLLAVGWDAGKKAETVMLTRLMFPFILLVGLAALWMGMLNARRIFAIPASASSMFNIGSIVGGVSLAWMLDPDFGPKAMIGMAIGTIIGGFLQWWIQIPRLRKEGFRFQLDLNWKDPHFQEVVRLLGPAIIGTAAVQVNVVVNTAFAASLGGDGPVTWLNAAFRLMQFPLGVFGVAIATATLPSLSASAAQSQMAEFRSTIRDSLRMTFALCIPSSVGLALLAEPILSIIYEHGKTTSLDIRMMAAALQGYALGLAAYAGIKVVSPAFVALGDARTPMRISLFSILINVVLNWTLIKIFGFGHAGLALATSIGATINFLVLAYLIRGRLQGIDGANLAGGLFRILVASAGMGLFCYSANRWLQTEIIMQSIGLKVLAIILVCLTGALLYGLLARGLNLHETKVFFNYVLRKLGRSETR